MMRRLYDASYSLDDFAMLFHFFSWYLLSEFLEREKEIQSSSVLS